MRKKERPYNSMFDLGLDFKVLDVLNSNKKVGVFQTCAGHEFGNPQMGNLWGENNSTSKNPKISFTYRGRLPYNKIHNYLKKLPNTTVYARGLSDGAIAFDLTPTKLQGDNKRWWNMVSKAVAKIK